MSTRLALWTHPTTCEVRVYIHSPASLKGELYLTPQEALEGAWRLQCVVGDLASRGLYEDLGYSLLRDYFRGSDLATLTWSEVLAHVSPLQANYNAVNAILKDPNADAYFDGARLEALVSEGLRMIQMDAVLCLPGMDRETTVEAYAQFSKIIEEANADETSVE